jgi:hypothetical protein
MPPARTEADSRYQSAAMQLGCSAVDCTRPTGFAHAGNTTEAMPWHSRIPDAALPETLLAGEMQQAAQKSDFVRVLYLSEAWAGRVIGHVNDVLWCERGDEDTVLGQPCLSWHFFVSVNFGQAHAAPPVTALGRCGGD